MDTLAAGKPTATQHHIRSPPPVLGTYQRGDRLLDGHWQAIPRGNDRMQFRVERRQIATARAISVQRGIPGKSPNQMEGCRLWRNRRQFKSCRHYRGYPK